MRAWASRLPNCDDTDAHLAVGAWIGANGDRIWLVQLGARLASRSLEAGWVRRLEGSRAVRVTQAGERVFADVLGLHLGEMAHAA